MNVNSLKNLTYRLPKGHIPWNKGLKGIHLSPATEFKNGRKDEKHPDKFDGISEKIWKKRKLQLV